MNWLVRPDIAWMVQGEHWYGMYACLLSGWPVSGGNIVGSLYRHVARSVVICTTDLLSLNSVICI